MLRPYLIIPQLIEQPTWGGDYILKLKGWGTRPEFADRKIGQSYELTGSSDLAVNVTDSADENFSPSIDDIDHIALQDLVNQNQEQILGPTLDTMPLLIKLNQAQGNSFQLHVKPGQQHPRWKPKPESWYFLEDGYVSLGIKEGIDIEQYKQTCRDINETMKQLSNRVLAREITLEEARQKAAEFIKSHDPKQFVNLYEVTKHDLIDLSQGGVHHSWEENEKVAPLGNVVYEVQLDVMDPECTIRSFDQGKIKDDGTIREIHIDDYFEFLDTDPKRNSYEYLKAEKENEKLLRTPYYSVDILQISDARQLITDNSFNHLYVREGDVEIIAAEGKMRLTQGHSGFVPWGVKEYIIKANKPAVVLKTYIS